eukprot:TRINITY_DN90511_c0_g1_i1.p1 TRINITY_DN90511_c0_g1~~TRINITY_DN90511_c0_g1_i1.p1  ORF type:complete len:1805 (+),score=371.90 TRINITY_DN90511_c0_g1_i1:147-5561(+)
MASNGLQLPRATRRLAVTSSGIQQPSTAPDAGLPEEEQVGNSRKRRRADDDDDEDWVPPAKVPRQDNGSRRAGNNGNAAREGGGLINNDFCEVCQKGGRLLFCEKCPRAFHAACIERLVDHQDLLYSDSWSCPVCLHGEDALRGYVSPKLTPEQMAAQMTDAARKDKRALTAIRRRRDAFLAYNAALIMPFTSRPGQTRIRKAAEDCRQEQQLEIGCVVQVAAVQRFQAVVLAQTGPRKYVVANTATGEEAEVDRSFMAPLAENSTGSFREVPDYLKHARRSLLAEGIALKDYQRLGVNWAVHAYHNRGGGILADDMGLGKTIQALTVLSFLRTSGLTSGPFLVVAPLSCLGNWVREAKRFVPHLTTAKVYGSSKERQYQLEEDDGIWYGTKDIIFTTYETISTTTDFFARHFWSVMVLDEAHRIKAEQTGAREALDSIDGSCRLLLTGTPLQNNLGELFALLRFLWPDILSKESDFLQEAIKAPGSVIAYSSSGKEIKTGLALNARNAEGEVTTDTIIDNSVIEKVRVMLSMLMLRRTKDQVLNLPPKVVRDVWLPLAPAQAAWYKKLQKCTKILADQGLRKLFALVTRLRLMCSHPRCLVMAQKDKDDLLRYPHVNEHEVKKLSDNAEFSEEFVAQSSKLLFLDKLLTQLHVQNMGLIPSWRAAFEQRQRKGKGTGVGDAEGEETKAAPAKKSAARWLKEVDGVTFLEEMRPYKPESDQEDLTPRPHQVLIFAQFHNCLDLLERFCAWRGWRTLRLDGSVPRTIRELDMRDFNSPEEDCFIYLLGTRSGGLGINLANANHVILWDQDWNPFVDQQAIDRAHRIGQHRKVNVYRILQEWSVEERLALRQMHKLKMEHAVIQANQPSFEGDEDAAPQMPKDKLDAAEILALLRNGEETMMRFQGESIGEKSLLELLERQRRPLPELPGAGGEGVEAIKVEGFVEAGGEDDVDCVAGTAAAVAAVAPPPPLPPVAQDVKKELSSSSLDDGADRVIGRTARGRMIRQPKMYEPPPEIVRRKVDKALMKHWKACFLCIPVDGAACDGAGKRPKRLEDIRNQPDTFCAMCPRAYHVECLSAQGKQVSGGKMWRCSWHTCQQCSRSANAAGGNLIHCLECPTALCYDCFPPDFRRVHPPEKFWSDLNARNWDVSPKTMVMYRCNNCRALAEERQRQKHTREDLEAQQDERKRQALAERRNLEAAKKAVEDEESRRRMKQLLLESERKDLRGRISDAQNELAEAAGFLWPAAFRQAWLEACSKCSLQDEIATLTQLRKMSSSVDLALRPSKLPDLEAAVPVCSNCEFPGHVSKQCPLPAEQMFMATASSKKKVCPLCECTGHSRILCGSLGEKDRQEYEARIQASKGLAMAMQQNAIRIAEPLPKTILETRKKGGLDQLCDTWWRMRQDVIALLEDVMRQNQLGHLVIFCPPPAIVTKAKAKVVAEPKAKQAPAKAAAKAKVKAQAKPKPKAKATAFLAAARAARPAAVAVEDVMEVQRAGDIWTDDRQIFEGPAIGWRVRVVVGAEHEIFYRPPGATQWQMPDQLAVKQAIKNALQQEVNEMFSNKLSQTLNLQHAGGQQGKQAGLRRAAHAGRRGVNAEAVPAVGEDESDLDEAREIEGGPANAWIVRGKVNNYNQCVLTFRAPGGTRWERKPQMVANAAQEVQDVLLKEAEDIANLLKKKRSDRRNAASSQRTLPAVTRRQEDRRAANAAPDDPADAVEVIGSLQPDDALAQSEEAEGGSQWSPRQAAKGSPSKTSPIAGSIAASSSKRSLLLSGQAGKTRAQKRLAISAEDAVQHVPEDMTDPESV